MKTIRTTPLLALAMAGPLFGANLSISPTSHDFGSVPLGQRRTVTIRVENSGVLAKTIPVKSSSPHFTVNDASLVIPGKQSRSLIVAISDRAPAGALSATITVDDGRDAVRVAVRAQVDAPTQPTPKPTQPAPGVTVSPTSLDFGTLDLGQAKALTFTVTSAAATSCTVGAPGLLTGFFEATPTTLSLTPNQPATVTVNFKPKVTLQNTGSATAKSTVTCGASKATVDLKGATPVPKRFKLSVAGAGLVTSINGLAPQDPQSSFGQVIGCNPAEQFPGTCANTVQAGVKVDMKAACGAPNKPFKWSVATGSAAPCQGSTNLACSFVINADTTLTADCR